MGQLPPGKGKLPALVWHSSQGRAHQAKTTWQKQWSDTRSWQGWQSQSWQETHWPQQQQQWWEKKKQEDWRQQEGRQKWVKKEQLVEEAKVKEEEKQL